VQAGSACKKGRGEPGGLDCLPALSFHDTRAITHYQFREQIPNESLILLRTGLKTWQLTDSFQENFRQFG
jgi:hypothetical protein